MSATRLILAAILGGIGMFVWGYVVHMVLPLGHSGVKELPSEPAVLAPMKSISEPAFYIFPGTGGKEMNAMSEAEKSEWTARQKAGPTGILVVHPNGREFNFVKLLGTEFGSNVAAAAFLAVIIACAGGGFGRGAVVGLFAGVFAWASIDVSYWNWYGFPSGVTMSSLVEQGVGWLIGGALIGLFARRRAVPAPA